MCWGIVAVIICCEMELILINKTHYTMNTPCGRPHSPQKHLLFLHCLFMLSLYLLLPAQSFAEAPKVTVAKPVLAELGESLRLSGSLTAEKQATLSPRMDGLVKEVLVDAGDTVKQGDILLRLDPAIAYQQLQQAKAATTEAHTGVDEAARLVKEAERLRGENYISATELANRQSNLALSHASFAAAKAMENRVAEELRRHDLPAPFSGVISAKMTESGEWINRGDQVLGLVALDAVRIDVSAPQERFAEITADSRVEIFPDSLPGQQFPAKIIALVPVSNPQARSFLVRMVVDADTTKLLPGTSATAVIHLQSDVQEITIPRDAILRHPDGGRSVFVVDDENLTSRRQILIGRESADGVVVTEGLSLDDRVVIRGNELLSDNLLVEITAE